MTPALLKSTKTKYKMYRQSLGKPKSSSSYINFKKYNKIKRLSKETYFTNELAIHRNDLTKTWKILKSLIGKFNDKSGISDSFKMNGSLCKEPKKYLTNFVTIFLKLVGNMQAIYTTCS